jgi:hypothetical protein
MNKFQDPALFPNDQLRGYRYINIHLPRDGDLPLYFYSLGYWLLFYAASFLVTPAFFVKILPFFVMPVVVWYLYEFGQSVCNRGTGTVLAAGFLFLNLASSTSLSVMTGLQRSFACPLMIALLYYLYRQKHVAAAVVILMSALIYPPVFLLATTTWGLFALKLERHPTVKLSVAKRELGLLLIAVSLGALALSPVLPPRFTNVLTSEKPMDVDRQPVGATPTSYKHLWDNPQYRAGGRKPLFYSFPFIGRGGLVNKGPDALHLLILFSVSCLICLVRGRRALDLPYVIWHMLWAGLIVFAAAWAAIWLTDSFLLYMPSRYTRVGLFLFLLMFVFLNIRGAIQDAVVLIQCNRQRLTWLMVGIELLALALILLSPPDRTLFLGVNMKWLLALASLTFGALGVAVIRKPSLSVADVPQSRQTPASRMLRGAAIVICLGVWVAYAPLISGASFLNPSQAERELLRFLETLPKDVLLAGTPCVLDNVPLFAKRRILFSCEQISKDADLTRQALSAYYADDKREIVDFCQTYRVDYLVVDLGAYSEEYLAAGKIFFEPYNQELLPHIAAQDTFALAQVSEDVKIFQSEDYFVVSCNDLIVQE